MMGDDGASGVHTINCQEKVKSKQEMFFETKYKYILPTKYLCVSADVFCVDDALDRASMCVCVCVVRVVVIQKRYIVYRKQ